MGRHVLVDESGVVVNVVVWDGVLFDPEDAPHGWSPPDGVTVVEVADGVRVEPGDVFPSDA